MFGMLLRAWQYRHFIYSSIKNDFLSRFARSRLGGLWMVIHPLAQVVIFAFVLSAVLSSKLPGMINNRFAYALYLMAGMLAWQLFSDLVLRSLTVFLDNGTLLKNMTFPRICLPLIVSGSALVNNILLFVAILGVFALLGQYPGWTTLWLPVLIVLNVMLGAGLGLLLGIFNVFIRDVGQVVPIVMQFLFWLTPVVYVPAALSSRFKDWLLLNPLTPLVNAYQNILVYGTQPRWLPLIGTAIFAIVSSILALFFFRKAAPEMVDTL
jgi:homopolymeric O-antigen transport system permease protein